ncbi:MAG: flagellar hook protein FlgE [Thermodesulfobacteriaceae bacterium]|jgi:flagellar hook protein FlgE
MGLTDALFTGTSGLRALGHGMSVIADNVANLNTTAFKGARITFSDIMAQSINTAAGTGQLGRGAAIQALFQQFVQGAFESTGNPTDMAIAGSGFFIVRNPKATGAVFYTRDGQFMIDKEGYLVNPQGLRVQGWRIDEITYDIFGAITDIRIDRSSPPVQTTKIDLITNLDARTETRSKVVNLSGNLYDDPATPGPTSVSTTFVIRDIDGKDNIIQVDLAYDASTQKWNFTIRNAITSEILAQGTNVTMTRTTITLPSTGERIHIDWGNITHDSAAPNTITIPGRDGRVELSGEIEANTWAYHDLSLVDANGTTRNLRVWLYYDTTTSRWNYRVFENPATPAPADPTGETGVLLVSGDLSNETDIYFFLDGTTQRVNLDWTRVRATDTPTVPFEAEIYKLEEINTLFDFWDARQEIPIPSTAYAYRSTLFVYDSLGTPHELTVYYSPTTRDNVWEFLVAINPTEDQRDFVRDENPMQWQYEEGAYIQRVSINSGKLFTQTKRGVLAYGRLEFDNQGNVKRFYQTYRLDANTGALVQIIDQNGSPVALPEDRYSAIGPNGYPLLIVDFLGIDLPFDIYPPNDPNQGTARLDLQKIELNFGYFYKDSWRSESVRTTQYATSNATLFYDQNGYGPGALEIITVDNEGRITGVYSNGRVIPLWMVALANFNAPERLQKVGGNLYRETTHSGPPVTGKPGTYGLGTISPNSLEQSNVDLGEQFVKMIIFQRGFQADARIITVSDTMLEELINLKR